MNSNISSKWFIITPFSCWISIKPNMASCGAKNGMTRFPLVYVWSWFQRFCVWVQSWKIWNGVSSSELQNEQRDRDTKTLFNSLYWNSWRNINFFPINVWSRQMFFKIMLRSRFSIFRKLGSYIILYCQAYLRCKLDFLNQKFWSNKKGITHSNYHQKLLQFHATSSVKHELFETI